MADSVFIPIEITEITETIEQPSKTYALDLDKGRIIGYVNGLKAVQQAIRKAIITPRFKCLIYDNQYGSEIEDALIANDTSREYIEAVVFGFLEACLKPDSRILRISDISLDFEKDGLYINFNADTIFGELNIEEVI